jgi:hypothetical protein
MSKSKGGRTRRRIEKYFRSKGYAVAKVETTGKFTKSKDLFSRDIEGNFSDCGFDSLALSQGNIIFIQAKTNTPATQKWYKLFAKEYANEVVEVLVATWVDREGLRLQWYEPDGSIIEGWVDSLEVNNSIKNNLH